MVEIDWRWGLLNARNYNDLYTDFLAAHVGLAFPPLQKNTFERTQRQ